MPHRKGLSGECAVADNGLEKHILRHTVIKDADGIFFFCKLLNRFNAVDIVHLHLGVLGDIIVKEILHCAYGKLGYGAIYLNRLLVLTIRKDHGLLIGMAVKRIEIGNKLALEYLKKLDKMPQ